MAKKKKSNLGLLLSACAALFAVFAVCMLFVKSISVVSGKNELQSFTGLQVAFGYSEEIANQKIGILKFSFMNLLPYLLMIGALVVSVLSAKKNSFLLNVIAAALGVVAAIFFFSATAYVCVAGTEGSGFFSGIWKNVIDALKDSDNLKIAIGSILGGVFSIISAICSAVKIIVK